MEDLVEILEKAKRKMLIRNTKIKEIHYNGIMILLRQNSNIQDILEIYRLKSK